MSDCSGRTDLMEDFKVNEHELVVLAMHYLKQLGDLEFYPRLYHPEIERDDGEWAWKSRLGSIEECLGEERFRKISDGHYEEWRRRVREARKALICQRCGVPQHYLGQLEQGVCSDCWQETGPAWGMSPASPVQWCFNESDRRILVPRGNKGVVRP